MVDKGQRKRKGNDNGNGISRGECDDKTEAKREAA